jgi:hypothetical protein
MRAKRTVLDFPGAFANVDKMNAMIRRLCPRPHETLLSGVPVNI